MRRLAFLSLLLLSLATGAASLWALSQNPFAQPVVERTGDALRLALDRAMARALPPDALVARIGQALAEGDRDRVAMLADLAAREGVVLPPAMAEAARQLAEGPALLDSVADCGACAWDVRACASLKLIAACALPVELTPLGDANALRRQAMHWAEGEEVDGVETGLALVGLGATAVVVVSGGSSAVLKGGATVARLARRMGTLSPGLTRILREAADVPVAWERVLPYLAGGVPFDAVVDTARLGRLGRVAGDLGEVARHTSPAEALVLMRHVETAEDAARLARLSAVAGRDTRVTLEVLGPARAFRAMVRVTDLALATIGLVAAFVAQVGMLAVSLALSLARRLLRPRPVARRPFPRHDRAAMGGGG
jgi:hypothetical protein